MEKDIKTSVRLPKTSFDMKGNLQSLEAKVINAWEEKDIYSALKKKNAKKQKFILHDGPPYANGHLHVGHALNKILKDIIVKASVNMGYNSPFVVGWDCHGLPIEWKIEEKYKEKNLRKEDVDINVFRDECKAFAESWVEVQKKEFKSLGVIADFNNPYLTMNYKAEAIIVKAVFDILKKGLLYQGKKPVLWSCVEKTALAEAEVEYQDKKSDSLYAGFCVEEAPNEKWRGAYAVIWTTTPWTLPANQALAYGKGLKYSLFLVEEVLEGSYVKVGSKLIIADELSESVFLALKVQKFIKLDTLEDLNGFKVKHCLYGMGYNYIVPMLAGDFIETNTGTGLVHIASAHGEDDFYLCKKNNITPKEVLLDSGNYKEDLPIFANEHIFKVNPKIIAKLEENATMFAKSQITHSYPHSWRSKAPLIYRLTTQWFISLDKDNTRKKAIECLDSIDFYPKTGKNRLKSMLENRPDWCISRQRAWGVPLGIFVNTKTKEPLIDEEVFANVIKAFEQEGASAWFKEDPKRFITSKYNKEDYIPVNDVVDVWLDSGTSSYYVLKEREELQFPADLYLEGSDQHRGWFQSSLVMSLLLFGKSPYKKVITHGFVLDEKHQKMSKSLGNTVVPQEVVKTHGADVLRIWVANCNFHEDVTIGKNILSQQAEAYRKIRNILRYLLANIANTNNLSTNIELKSFKLENLEEIDKWVLHNVYTLDSLFHQTFEETFTLHNFFSKVFNFMTVDLSAFYFDIKKDILYCEGDKSPKYLATIYTLDVLFNYLIKWLSPFIPFTAEEAFANYKKQEVGELFLQDFEKFAYMFHNEKLFKKWEVIKKIRKVVTGAIEQVRAQKEIGSSLEAHPVLYISEEYMPFLSGVDFAEICIASNISIHNLKNITNEEKSNAFSLSEVENVFVLFSRAAGHKCSRCWKFYDELQEDLCHRCHNVVNS